MENKRELLISVGNPIRNRQIKELSNVLLHPRERAIIKVEANVEKIKERKKDMEGKEKSLTGYYTKNIAIIKVKS